MLMSMAVESTDGKWGLIYAGIDNLKQHSSKTFANFYAVIIVQIANKVGCKKKFLCHS
jgi:hypothetical protein